MAKDKSSFMLYCDLIHTVELLPNDKAGELLKHILRYVNDKNPSINDPLLQVTFEPIRQTLKRDLKKYEAKCLKNSENVKKRWGQKNIQSYTNVYERIRTDTKHTDSDSDSDILSKDNNINNPKPAVSVDWDAFKKQFNLITGKKIRVVDDKTKRQMKARLKEGYSKDDIVTALQNACNDAYHKETGLKYITPEFITRPDKLSKYATANDVRPKPKDRL